MANSKLTPAPDAKRCEAGATEAQPSGTCGAGQPLYTSNGIVHCEHHIDWPSSKEAKIFLAIKAIKEEK